MSGKSSTGVTLSGSFANATGTPTEVGFYYGTDPDSMTGWKSASYSTDGSGGTFSASIVNLNVGTRYYYQAYVKMAGTGAYLSQIAESYGSVLDFTTNPAHVSGADPEPAVMGKDWLELPAAIDVSHYDVNTYYDGSNRN